MSEAVSVHDVTKVYALGQTRVPALSGVTLAVSEGEFMAVAGPSGSGKSTLLNLIGCLDRPTSGRVVIGGQDVSQLGDDQLSDLRAHRIGFIFQTFNLIPVLSAAENVEFPLLVRAGAPLPRHQAREKARLALDQVGLGDFARHRPDELSGGQRQRVAVARALVTLPALVLADEPTANLDRATAMQLMELLAELNAELGTTIVMVTHDEQLAARYCRRTIAMADGRLTHAEASESAPEASP